MLLVSVCTGAYEATWVLGKLNWVLNHLFWKGWFVLVVTVRTGAYKGSWALVVLSWCLRLGIR